MAFRLDDQATGQVITLMVAGAIFMAAVGTILVVGQEASNNPGRSREAAKGVEAAGLADILFGSPGVGWGDPDALDRLGLLADNGSGLDAGRVDALRGAAASSTDNGKVDYEDALESLGMDPAASAGFHLRIYPVGLEELEARHDLRIAYIADWTPLVSVTVSSPLVPVLNAETAALKANAALNASLGAASPSKLLLLSHERQVVRALGMEFNDRVHITAAAPAILVDYTVPLVPDKALLGASSALNLALLEGDVYPDDKAYLKDTLPGRLGQYDVVIVGSGVDHANLVNVKDDFSRWVMAEGGTLIVLGSADKSTAWLNPLLNAGVHTVNGAPTAPDIAHPLLKTPNGLAWTAYDSHGQGWDIRGAGAPSAYEDFSHVVIQDGKDVLAVSKEASFGLGRLILSTYYAGDIAQNVSLEEAAAFLENLVTYADRSAFYLDYGGLVPADQPVALAVRQNWLWDDVYGQVPVRIEVLAWG